MDLKSGFFRYNSSINKITYQLKLAWISGHSRILSSPSCAPNLPHCNPTKLPFYQNSRLGLLNEPGEGREADLAMSKAYV